MNKIIAEIGSGNEKSERVVTQSICGHSGREFRRSENRDKIIYEISLVPNKAGQALAA